MCWAGEFFRLLYEPYMDMPLVISPVINFLAASVLFYYWYLLAATVLLEIGHVYVSSLKRRQVTAHFETTG
jgi:hypothetical protein